MKINDVVGIVSVPVPKQGALAYFFLGVLPHAISTSYLITYTNIPMQDAFFIAAVIGAVLFFSTNYFTKKHFDFWYEPTIKTFFLLTFQALVAAAPATMLAAILSGKWAITPLFLAVLMS